MAIEKNTKSVGMKVVSNYGEVDGKTVRKTRTYGDVKETAADDKIYATYKHIKGMQSALGEECLKVTTDSIMEIV